jgi:hypothetical protein
METPVTFQLILVAIIWGALSGYLMLRMLDSLIATAFCLHGLLMSRWKRLVNKASPGQIKYSIILRLLLRVTIYVMMFGFLLEVGDNVVWREFHFDYQGTAGLIWGAMAVIIAAIFSRASWRRMVVVWKMTHVFDYAEKRQRTFFLKG